MGRPEGEGARRETREAILDAAEAFLEGGGRLRDLTVTALMAPIPVSREAFYKHFSSRYELIAALVGRFTAEVAPGFELWLGGRDPARDVRAMFDLASDVYVRRAATLRAVVDAAPLDPDLEAVWRSFLGTFIEAAARRIRADQGSGVASRSVDADLAAASMVHLIERLITQELVRPQPPSREDVVDLLTATMVGLVYTPQNGVGMKRSGRSASR
jgi:TetR/AcrR family transcriptional regulator, ethionamide resistance regulator